MRFIILTAFSFFLISAFIPLPGCKISKQNSSARGKTGSPDTIPKIIVDNTVNPDSSGAKFSIDTVAMAGGSSDVLEIKVKYSGGCREHDFKLVSGKRYMKSMPPQLKLVLVHNNNQDHCRNLISRTLRFNISDIKYAGQKKLLLSVNDYPYKIEYLY